MLQKFLSALPARAVLKRKLLPTLLTLLPIMLLILSCIFAMPAASAASDAKVPEYYYDYLTDRTPIQTAIYHGHFDQVPELLKAGAEINASTRRWGTALDVAVFCRASTTAGLLVEKGARGAAELKRETVDWEQTMNILHPPPSMGAHAGITALDQAVSNQDFNTVKAMVEAGIDVNQCLQVNTALDIAFSFRNRKICALLLKHGARSADPDLNAIAHNEIPKLPRSFGIISPSVFRSVSGTNSILHMAAFFDNIPLARLCSRHKEMINAHSDWEQQGETPLGIAIDTGDDELTALLVNAGADVDGQFGTSDEQIAGKVRTPLEKACRASNNKTVALLLDHGHELDNPYALDSKWRLLKIAREAKNAGAISAFHERNLDREAAPKGMSIAAMESRLERYKEDSLSREYLNNAHYRMIGNPGDLENLLNHPKLDQVREFLWLNFCSIMPHSDMAPFAKINLKRTGLEALTPTFMAIGSKLKR